MSQSESSAEKRMSQYRWFEILTNRPFPSSLGPLYQNEVRCSTFLVEMSFICMRMKNHFHIKGWAPNLVLIQRSRGTRKWPVTNCGNTNQGNCKITLGAQLRTTLTQRPRQKDTFHEYYAIAELWFDYLSLAYCQGIDPFSLYILFSQFRPRDILKGICLSGYACICTWIVRHL